LLNFYHTYKFLDHSKNLFQKILIANAKKLPIKNTLIQTEQKLTSLVEAIINFKERLISQKDKQTDEKARLEKEIQKIDNEIDEEIYKLYGITEEEKKIIEESLK